MSIYPFSWNVCGMGNREKRPVIKNVVSRSKANVILLLEMKLTSFDMRFAWEICSFAFLDGLSLPSVGGLGPLGAYGLSGILLKLG